MRALKVAVVVMGIMLIVGFAVLVGVIVGRVSGKTAPRSFATIIDIPRGARIEMIAVGADRIVLNMVLPDGGRQLLLIDAMTGIRLGAVELRTTP
jgi:Family of unknown function (DUF6476)